MDATGAFTPMWVVPMGTGASATMGYGQAAYVHDFSVFDTGGWSWNFSPMDVNDGGLSRGVYDHSTSNPHPNYWANAFFFGNTPAVLQPNNWGYLTPYNWNPVGYDWANGYYKGECGYGTNFPAGSMGSPLTGLSQSAFDGLHGAHAVLCNFPAIYQRQPMLYGYVFRLRRELLQSGMWDYSYAILECAVGDYAIGVSANTNGIHNILCCPGQYDSGPNRVSLRQSSCSVQVFYSQDSSGFGPNGVQWDPWYYKGQCPPGQYVAGLSKVYTSSQGVVGAPHALLCCNP